MTGPTVRILALVVFAVVLAAFLAGALDDLLGGAR